MKPNICPFCGHNKLRVISKITYSDYHGEDTINASVRCNKCHARGPLISYTQKHYTKPPSKSEIEFTKELNRELKAEAEKLAIEAWNVTLR